MLAWIRKYGYVAASAGALIVFAASMASIFGYYADTRSAKSQMEQARTLYRAEEPTVERAEADPRPPAEVVAPAPSSAATKPETVAAQSPFDPDAVRKLIVQDRFKPLLNKNADTVGWLTIAGTSIDYPVVQAEDNAYYLRRDFERDSNVTGSIFMDYRNDIGQQEKHWILYGHYMKEEIMFKGLLKYRDEAYYREHPIVTFDTLYGDQQWLVFSAYDTNADEDYIRTVFDREDEFAAFASVLKSNSLYDTGVEVGAGDRVLTLSTCSRTEEGGRFTVHAKLVTGAS
ncbi:class B sortase [Cohnella sp. GCM10027633]|uniref:class B sortase n=1 Tax=unclassified Cohnella TaxID=2636738 RepID=UPI0036266668